MPFLFKGFESPVVKLASEWLVDIRIMVNFTHPIHNAKILQILPSGTGPCQADM